MATNGVCVCAVGYYQTAPASGDAPSCMLSICPAGSTTTTADSQGISDCGKNSTIIIPINWH